MRKRRFLAIAAALALSMSMALPVTVSATVTDNSDTTEEEQEEGEQETVMEPDADEPAANSGSSSNTSSGSSASQTGTGSTASSSDSSLAHLGISPGSLSPAFSAGTLAYTATVDANVMAISVAARPNSSKAVIASVSGAKSLTPGTNTVKVVVEAQNGQTTTYTITVNCGQATANAETADTAGDTPQTEPAEPADGADDGLQGTVDVIGDTTEPDVKEEVVTFDDNGYLIYEGNAYIPSELMPEGEYVSLDKYNRLYDQAQSQKSMYMRICIVLAVLLVLALIVVLNLALKLRDLKQDIRMGLGDLDEDDLADFMMPEKQPAKKADKGSEKKPEKRPDKKTEKRPEKKADKKPDKKPETGAKQPVAADTTMIPDVKLPEDFEILDLNDL